MKTDARLDELLKSGEIYATVMLAVVTDRLGSACLSWAPKTLFLEIKDEFGFEPAPIALDKLMAAVAIVTTDRFFKDVTAFIQICNVLCDTPFNPEVFDPADALECAWGITEGLILAPPEHDDVFSAEIRAYIGEVLKEEGFLKAPDVLAVATGLEHNKEYAFLEDDELRESVKKEQIRKIDEITDSVKENLLELIGQLQAVNWRSGSADDIAKRLAGMLTTRNAA